VEIISEFQMKIIQILSTGYSDDRVGMIFSKIGGPQSQYTLLRGQKNPKYEII